MENQTGKWHPKNTSSLSLNVALALEILFLAMLGMLAIVLHARLRIPLGIPGKHGLEFMAILISGRMLSRHTVATSYSSLGIGLLLLFPVFGFFDPMMGFHYMIPGILLDIFYGIYTSLQKKVWFIALISGIAYMSIPLSRLIINLVVGIPYSSFMKHGVPATTASFFLFGLLGGLIGAGIIFSVNKIKKS